MTTRTCYLHIGTPKAGSTSIQGFLHTKRDALKKAGVDVPTIGTDDIFQGGVKISRSFEAERNLEEPKRHAWKWLDEYIRTTTDDFCISRESFCRPLAEKQKADQLIGFFARRGVRLKVIAYVRDTTGLVNANYTQGVKRFAINRTFPAWADAVIEQPPIIMTNMRIFRRMLNDDGVEFVARPLQSLGSKGLIGDFVEQLERPHFDWSGYDDTPYRNQTPGAKTMAASLVVGNLIKSGLREGMLKDLDKGREHGRQFRALAASRGWKDAPFYGPDASISERLEERFAAQNDKFAERAWGRTWREVVPLQTREQSIFDLERAPAHEKAEVMDLAKEFVDSIANSTLKRRALALARGGKAGKVSADFPGD